MSRIPHSSSSAASTARAGRERRRFAASAAPLPVMRVARADEAAPVARNPTTGVVVPTFPSRTFDLIDYGLTRSTSRGPRDITEAVNAAIRACSKAGGGRVVVPAGRWISGAIHLLSDVELHLSDGCELRFDPTPSRYLPAVFVRWSGQECLNYSPLIYAHRCRNIAITGGGRILGGGAAWWPWQKTEGLAAQRLYRMVLDDVPVAQRIVAQSNGNGHVNGSKRRAKAGDAGNGALPVAADGRLRPQLIAPIECDGVLIDGITIAEGGPFWSVHLAYCNDVTVRGLRVDVRDGPNTNAVVVDSSRNVLIDDCDLRANDDCVALKSGMNKDGWRVGRPTEDVEVRNVRCGGGHGGVSIGSEMSGGVRRVRVHDCRFDDLAVGVRFKAARGRGGVVEDVVIERIAMGDIAGDAIQIDTEFTSFASKDGPPPTFRDIVIRDVSCRRARAAARLVGQSDCAIQNVALEHLTITADEGITCVSSTGVSLLDVRVTPRVGPVIAVRDGQDVTISGLHVGEKDGRDPADADEVAGGVFLDLRGRRTRNVRLLGEARDGAARRPAVVLGADVPRDALIHD